MILTKEILVAEVTEHLNEVVLDGLHVVRLVGCAEDENDFYYKLDKGFSPQYAKYGHGISYSSAVGTPYYLKDVLPKEDYDRLDSLREINGAEKVESFEFEWIGDDVKSWRKNEK